MVRKATSEAEKQKYRSEGRCFECSKQGHLARNCPDKKPCARAAESPSATNDTPTPSASMPFTSDIAARILKFSDDECGELVRIMREAGEDAGF